MGHYSRRYVRTTCPRNVCQYIACGVYLLLSLYFVYTTARSPPVLRTGIGLAGAYWPGLGSSRNLSWSRNGPVVMKIRACHVSRLHRQFMSVLPLPPTVMYTRYIRKYCTVDISPSLVQRTHFGRAKDSKGSVGLVYLGLG